MATPAEEFAALEQTELWIDGAPRPPAAGRYFDDLDPEDDQVLARVARANATDVESAVTRATEAFAHWSQSLPGEREAALCRAADLLDRDRDAYSELLIAAGGSPFIKAQFEIDFSIRFLRSAAGMARRMRGETIPSDTPGRFSMSLREPLGVVAAITPFNVPLIKGVKQTATALALGDAVVLLTSELMPRIGLMLAATFKEAGIPDGVFNVVTGEGAEIGDSLTAHPVVRAVMFTGSTRVGRHISEICGKAQKRLVLELGGKNPMVVLADADLDRAVDAAVFGMFLYQGQICMAASRIFVEASVCDAFLHCFKRRAEAIGMGDLHAPDTWVGPIISQRQRERERVRSHIDDARTQGATLVTGGGWHGNRCEPTIFTDVTEHMTLCREETFGPVTAVYPVADAAAALARANDTDYGLSAAVFTNDINYALVLARGIRAGMVHINAPTLHDEPHVPFGGVGESGFGREGTDVDIDTLTEWKWITVQLSNGDAH